MRIARSLEFIAARGLATTVTGHCPPVYHHHGHLPLGGGRVYSYSVTVQVYGRRC